MAFWKRRKKDAIAVWQSDTATSQAVPEEAVTSGDAITFDSPAEVVTSVNSITVDARDFDPSNALHREAITAAEAMTGIDLDGDGKISGLPSGAQILAGDRRRHGHRV